MVLYLLKFGLDSIYQSQVDIKITESQIKLQNPSN